MLTELVSFRNEISQLQASGDKSDLSFPEGASVNDAIDPTKCSLSYISVDDVANRAILLGKGSLIAKMDTV